jgi:hypothetical protein
VPNFAVIDKKTKKPYLGNRSWDTRDAAETVRKDLLKYHPLDNEWHKRLAVQEIERALKPPEVAKGRSGGGRPNTGKPSLKKNRPSGVEYGKSLRIGPAKYG